MSHAHQPFRTLSNYLGLDGHEGHMLSARQDLTQECGFFVDDENGGWVACPLKTRTKEDPRKTEALIRAAADGKAEVVEKLLSSGSEVWHCDANGGTALHFAAYHNKVAAAHVLLRHGADRNAHEKNETTRSTPLHAAAMHGHEAMVRALMDAAANSMIKDASGSTPRELAQIRGHSKVVDLLRRHIYVAASLGQLHMVQLLLDHGADPDTCESSSSTSTPMHIASHKGYFEIVNVLKQAGANTLARNNLGRTPIELAEEVINRDGVAHPSAQWGWAESQRMESVRGHLQVIKILSSTTLGEQRIYADALLQTTTRRLVDHGLMKLGGVSPDCDDLISRPRAEGGTKVFFELGENAAIFEEAGLGPIKDPKLLVVFMYELVTELLDVHGMTERFEFGTWSVAGTRILIEESMRLASTIVASGRSYTRVLLIGPTWNEKILSELRPAQRLDLDAWTQSLKKLVNAEPEESPLRAFHISLRGTLPKAKLMVFNSTVDPATAQPRFPQLQLSIR